MKNTNREDEEIKVSKKFLPLRIVLFVLALAIAATAFAFFFTSLDRKEEGYYKVTASAKREAPAYHLIVEAMYHFSGKSSEINSQISSMQSVLTENAFNIYTALDDQKIYDTNSSIAVINKNVGQEVQVSELVYSYLKKAYDYSSQYENYSIYAQPIYDFWDNITHLDEQSRIAQDVVNYPENQAYLNSLLNYCRKEHCSLSFLSGNKVKLEISAEYQSFIEENKIESPIVSVNILRVPFMLNYIKNVFETKGYKDGYLITPYEYTVNLSGQKYLDHLFYVDEPGKDSYLIGVKARYEKAHNAYSSLRFHTYQNDGIYNFKKDDATYYRHLNLNIQTGLPNQLVSALVAIEEGENDLDSMALKLNELNKIENIDDYYAKLLSSEYQTMKFIASNNVDDKIAISSSLYGKCEITESIKNRVIQK